MFYHHFWCHMPNIFLVRERGWQFPIHNPATKNSDWLIVCPAREIINNGVIWINDKLARRPAGCIRCRIKNDMGSQLFYMFGDRQWLKSWCWELTRAQCRCLNPQALGKARFKPVELADLGRFNTNSMAFQVFVSSIPIQCVPAETVPVAFTWHCPGIVGKKGKSYLFTLVCCHGNN